MSHAELLPCRGCLRRLALIVATLCLLAPPALAAEPWETLPAPLSLPLTTQTGFVTVDGARLWYAAYGAGPPVILLHGGLANSDTWGGQIPALTGTRRVILIDTRGHGRSTRDDRPLTYELLASDVIRVMDSLNIDRADVVGWSDGAIVGLVMAMKTPKRIGRLFAFAANADPTGAKPGAMSNPTLIRFGQLAAEDYRSQSNSPDGFGQLAAAVMKMWATQPNYTAAELATISTPVAIVDGDHDEGIRREHTEYLARAIPQARLIILHDTSHFAHLQDPAAFNAAMLDFLGNGQPAAPSPSRPE